MKKFIFTALAAITLLPMGSCKDDNDIHVKKIDPDYVTIHFGLTFSGMEGTPDTRSLAPGYKFADGKSISVLKCYVYNTSKGNASAPSQVIDIDIKDVNENRGGDMELQLPKDETYDLVFLGTSIPQTTASSKLYYNSTERSLTVNYATVAGNDEELDCFYAVKSGVTTSTAFTDVVVLKRPYAQLNIGTADYNSYNSTTPVKDIAVSVDGVYNKMTLMDGQVVGSPIKANFLASAVPVGQVFPVNDYSYLSMNYLLVNTRKLVNLSLTVNHTSPSNSANTIEISNIAVERNYQTNVYGQQILSGVISQ